MKQNGISVFDYFNELDALWKEFDGLTSLTEYTCEAAVKLNDHAKLMKLMQFLVVWMSHITRLKVIYYLWIHFQMLKLFFQ